MDNGMTREEYHFFLHNNLRHHCIMGNDYYPTNEHYVSADGMTHASGEIFGYAVGVPIIGFTWYSLTDQVDWDIALREERGTVNPLGLFDLNRNIRPVGEAYRNLIRDWGAVLPTQSMCLHVPIVMPNQAYRAGTDPAPRMTAEMLREPAPARPRQPQPLNKEQHA